MKTFIILLLIFLNTSCQPKKDLSQLVLGLDSSPRHIDPRYGIDATSQYLESLLYCSLFRFDKNGTLTSWVAKDYQWINPKTLSVKIKDNIKYHNGASLVIDDIIATYSFFLNPDTTSARKHGFKSIEKIERKSDEELIIYLKNSDASFMTNLIVGILPKQQALQTDTITDPKKLSYCGPFELKSKGDFNIELALNEKYFLYENKNQIKKVKLKIVKDERTRLAKLKSGEIDLLVNALSYDLLKYIDQNKESKYYLQQDMGLNTSYIAFNFKDQILSNIKVRKAISLAIDRNQIIDKIYSGRAVLANSLILPQSPYSIALPGQETNIEKAKKLLDEAGYKENQETGVRLNLTYSTSTNSFRVMVAKAIASQLEKIGIKVEVQSKEWGKFKADIDSGKAQLWSLRWVGYKDPNIFHYVFSSESFPPNGGNRGFYKNNTLDELLERAKMELDKEKRIQLFTKVQKIVNEDLPYIFLWHEKNIALIRNEWENFQLYADGRFDSIVNVKLKQ